MTYLPTNNRMPFLIKFLKRVGFLETTELMTTSNDPQTTEKAEIFKKPIIAS